MFPFSVTAKRLQSQKALFAIASHETLMSALRRVYAECGFTSQKTTLCEIVHYPGGMLDWVTSHAAGNSFIEADQRGFIRRVPGKARAIELMVDPKSIPALDRPFTF